MYNSILCIQLHTLELYIIKIDILIQQIQILSLLLYKCMIEI